jgi:hypothetical protein
MLLSETWAHITGETKSTAGCLQQILQLITIKPYNNTTRAQAYGFSIVILLSNGRHDQIHFYGFMGFPGVARQFWHL